MRRKLKFYRSSKIRRTSKSSKNLASRLGDFIITFLIELNFFRPQLLDLAAAAQTADSHAAAIEVLNFKSDSGLDSAERYLMAVSLSTHPSEFLLQGIFLYLVNYNSQLFLILCFLLSDLLRLSKTIKIEKLYQTSLLSLAAVTKAFSLNEENALKPVKLNIF